MSQCVGIKKCGARCTVIVIGETPNPRCGTHLATMFKVGPNNIRRNELALVNTREKRLLLDSLQGPALKAALREQQIKYLTDLQSLEKQIDKETEENGGNDADFPFVERERARWAAERARYRAAIAERQARRAALIAREARRAAVAERQAHLAAQNAGGELAQLAADRQNVHTAVVVEKVQRTVETVLTIIVPPEYQTETLKTPGEIILECGLTKESAWQMMAKYCADDEIYDMGRGIYARVLNSVWQYIKTSPHIEDLKKILAVELKDNIGMCAQGNLSRLCNILSGYLDGVDTEAKTKNETIGERFSALLDIDNLQQRLEAGQRILEELNVPLEDRGHWIDALN